MTYLGEYNYASDDEYTADADGSTSFAVFLTVSPKPSTYPLTSQQQYTLHMFPLMKILKHFDFYGCVEFTPLKGFFHIHCHLNITQKTKARWIKSVFLLRKIGNCDIRLIKETETDYERVHKYIHKDVELTTELLNSKPCKNNTYRKDPSPATKALIDTKYATSYDKLLLSEVDVTTPLDLGITKLSIKKKQTDSTTPPPMDC